MEYKEMKEIWDSQKASGDPGVDVTALHQNIRKHGVCIETTLNIFEFAMVLSLWIPTVVLAIKRVTGGLSFASDAIFIGLMFLVTLSTTSWVIVRRIFRKRHELAFPASIVGDLDKAVYRVDFHLSRIKTIHWWYLFPMFLIVALNRLISRGGNVNALDQGWLYTGGIFVLASMTVGWLLIRSELRRIHSPRKVSLLELRDRLLSE